MNILVYYPYNQRSVEQQSVMEMLKQRGYQVYLLTTCGEGYIHDFVRRIGVKAFASPVQKEGIGGYIKQAAHLRRFCKAHKIEIIFAHQQIAALPAMIVSPFIKARIAYFRHNADEDYQANPVKAKRMNGLLNRFLSVLVAPSEKVFRHWVDKEKVSPTRITRINYGYNFDQYEKPDTDKVREIKDQYPAALRIVSVARFVPAKNHLLMFEIVEAAVKEGMDCVFLCLGTGPEEASLKKWVEDHQMQKHIHIIGYRSNIFDYLAAADLYLHLSSAEASNSSVKEAALAECPAIVCHGVGDFEDYIDDGRNGFLVEKNPKKDDVLKIIREINADKTKLKQIGKEFEATVRRKFDIQQVVVTYEDFIKKLSA